MSPRHSLLLVKLVRDIWRSRGQFLAVTLVVFVGIMLFDEMFTSFVNFKGSVEQSYRRMNMNDVIFRVPGAPPEAARRTASVPGVRAAHGRLVRDVPVILEGAATRVTARLISIPDPDEGRVNSLLPNRGHPDWPRGLRSVLAETRVARYYNLERGSVIRPVIDGRVEELTVDGTAASPETVYPIKDVFQLDATGRTFGVFFISRGTAVELFGGGSIDEIAVILQPNTAREQRRVVSEIEQMLSPYGLQGTIWRKDQPSPAIVQQEIDGISTMGTIFPMLFIGVASMVIFVLTVRLVRSQRTQIGLIRALGLTSGAVARHYLTYGLLIGGAGGILGWIAGHNLSGLAIDAYRTFYTVPFLTTSPVWEVGIAGFGLAVGACLAAGLGAARQAASILPAAAMRPESPSGASSAVRIERLPGYGRLTFVGRIAAKNLLRQPRRTLSTILAVAASLILILTAGSFLDAMDILLTHYYDELVQYDAQIIFSRPVEEAVLSEIRSWPEVLEAEPLVDYPVRLRYAGNRLDSSVSGLSSKPMLILEDADGRSLPLTGEGIILRDYQARKLGVRIGDTLMVEPMTPGLGMRRFKLEAIAFNPMGVGGYLPIEQVREMVRYEGAVTAVALKLRRGGADSLWKRVSDLSLVAGTEVKARAKKDIEDYLHVVYAIVGIMVFAGVLLTAAVVFTITQVNIMERIQELASFRMIGMSRGQIGRLISLESLATSLAGILIGLPSGRALAGWMSQTFSNDLIVMPPGIHFRTYAGAVVCVWLAVLAAQWPSLRSAAAVSLAEAAKSREA